MFSFRKHTVTMHSRSCWAPSEAFCRRISTARMPAINARPKASCALAAGRTPGASLKMKWRRGPKAANFVLRVISRLYSLERAWDEANVDERRAELWREHFARPLRWLRYLATALGKQVLPQSQLGKACSYLLNHWDVLVAHQKHSFTRLDNCLVANGIRASAIGKKNWLFIGHPTAGQRSAIIYSLVVSCQRHGKDPVAYLRDVLRRLPSVSGVAAGITPRLTTPADHIALRAIPEVALVTVIDTTPSMSEVGRSAGPDSIHPADLPFVPVGLNALQVADQSQDEAGLDRGGPA